MNAVQVDVEHLSNGQQINVIRVKPQVRVKAYNEELSGVVHASKAWGRSQVWIQTNTDRYGNEDGWPQSIAGRADQAIQAGRMVGGGRDKDAMHGDAMAVSLAVKGMPENPYRVLWMHYVLVKARQYQMEEQADQTETMLYYMGGKVFSIPRMKKVRVWGNWYKMPVSAKARELQLATSDYYKHLNGAHMWIAARLESVRSVCES